MALALYAVVAIALLLLSRRFIRPRSRTSAAVLFLLPLVFTGYALLTSLVGPDMAAFEKRWAKETLALDYR